MATKLKDGDTLVFIGDSITDCGRREDRGKPYGFGYVRMFVDMLIAREPRKHVTVINEGIGGNTVEDLRSRWQDCVIAHKPDWLSVKIGINDCNRHLNSAPDSLQSPENYAALYDQVLAETRQKLPDCKLLLIDPFFISKDRMRGSYRAKVLRALPAYIDIVHALSRKYRTRLVTTHAIFQSHLRHQPWTVYCPEPVHPNTVGHMVIADAVYAALSA